MCVKLGCFFRNFGGAGVMDENALEFIWRGEENNLIEVKIFYFPSK